MLTRLTHAAIAFAVTAVAYQAYVLAVAPFIEPPATILPTADIAGDGGYAEGPEALNKYQELLAAYFPPGHWCFARPPKTLENETRTILAVFDGDTKTPNGVLRVPHCALLFFPKPRDRAAAAPRDAIILESSDGAVLQMEAEGAAGGRSATGFGRLQYGQLSGEVVIRSDMSLPGPGDDLRLVTRDIYINEDLIRTDQTVDLRVGEHRAFGRELELRWLKTEGGPSSPVGLYGAFEDLVIKHDVSLIIAPNNTRLAEAGPARESLATGGPDGSDESPVAKDSRPPAAQPPLRITSAGPFRIDFSDYKATFSDNVRAWQLQVDGTMDELLARELTLFFTKTTQWNNEAPSPAPGGGRNGMSFEPASIEALGESDKPVVLNAPSYEASARGERLWIELINRRLHRITLERGEEVSLSHRGSEITARMLRYTLPSPDSNQRIGTLTARGAGRLLAIVDPARPYDLLEVKWQQAMHLLRRNERLVLVLDGRPTVSMAVAGRLRADQLQLFLKELPPPDAKSPGVGGAANEGLASSLSSTVAPELITASGNVAIESPELTGMVNQLNIKFEAPSASLPPSSAAGATANAGPAGGASTAGLASGGSATRRYEVSGVELKIDVALRERQAVVRNLGIDGSVVFQELPTVPGGAPPLKIEAERVSIAALDTPGAQIEIAGGATGGQPLQNAVIVARGATLRAPRLTINRGADQGWINSPGQLQLLVDRDMAGNPLPAPTTLDVTWQNSMKLEGRRITFLGDVLVQHPSGRLRTPRLVLQTTQALRLDGSAGNGQPQLEQIECWEGAVAQFEQRDLSGVSSRQFAEVQSLVINQISGAITGSGPGRIDSIHLAGGAGQLLAQPPGGGPQAPRLVQPEQGLRHLHVDFVRAISGNLHTKTVGVEGDVRTVYGPVATWDSRLIMTPSGHPQADEVWITSDRLQVAENPRARLNNQQSRQVELLAEGKVTIEGQAPPQGAFTAYGHRAKYDQSKGNFILEGNGTTPATIEQQPYPGGPRSPSSAHRMLYNHLTGHLKIEGLEGAQFDRVQP
ncbi:MAG: hypothetical protein IT424_06495 [Pirellulales bacterium]|nr:hypothetical protein [Pirellulales bacterium]